MKNEDKKIEGMWKVQNRYTTGQLQAPTSKALAVGRGS